MRDVCLVPSSHNGVGKGDCGSSEILLLDPDGEFLSRSSTFPLLGSFLRKYELLSATSYDAEVYASLNFCESLGDPVFSLICFF